MRVKQKFKNCSRFFLIILLVELEVFLNNNNKLLNIAIIDIAFYTKLINKKNQRKNTKLFFIIFKKI